MHYLETLVYELTLDWSRSGQQFWRGVEVV